MLCFFSNRAKLCNDNYEFKCIYYIINNTITEKCDINIIIILIICKHQIISYINICRFNHFRTFITDICSPKIRFDYKPCTTV